MITRLVMPCMQRVCAAMGVGVRQLLCRAREGCLETDHPKDGMRWSAGKMVCLTAYALSRLSGFDQAVALGIGDNAIAPCAFGAIKRSVGFPA
jgi:hypothetical protein